MTPARAPYFTPWAFTPPGEWADDAACLNHDPDLWFADRPARAVAICRSCPVQDECYDYAVANGEVCGVFGGRVFGVGKRFRQLRGRYHEGEAS